MMRSSHVISGWRIGWACAPANIASAIRNIHVKLTDSAPAPFQEAALTALKSSREYFQSLKTSYEARRDYAVEMLSELGLRIEFKPQGSIFVFAELPEKWSNSDVDFVRMLTEKAGVVAVPGCGFFHDKSGSAGKYCDRFVRFAFCKSDETLRTAARRFRELAAGKVQDRFQTKWRGFISWSRWSGGGSNGGADLGTFGQQKENIFRGFRPSKREDRSSIWRRNGYRRNKKSVQHNPPTDNNNRSFLIAGNHNIPPPFSSSEKDLHLVGKPKLELMYFSLGSVWDSSGGLKSYCPDRAVLKELSGEQF
ncbi:hypothetical protein KSP39_PZI017389 [Platanthera zijinensis]|uniref:Aminotransferase class I/classII large domain-containing protein n=1 Tax=Platanthera zijinensis TaxID=2320716 RepID=A0AAP0G027_9ASPA